MRTRVAAALQKILMFQDVRARVADATPSVVAPLVGLLQHPKGASSKKRGRGSPEQSGWTKEEGKQGHQQETEKKKEHRGFLARGEGAGDDVCREEEARNEADNLTSKVSHGNSSYRWYRLAFHSLVPVLRRAIIPHTGPHFSPAMPVFSADVQSSTT